MEQYRLDLKAIEQSLRDVQREFPKINELLHSRRDSMTDEVLENMLAGYAFIDRAVADGVDLFMLRHITDLLELNHIVLCGLNQHIREEYQTHIEAATQRFHEQEEFNIDDILRWYYRHENETSWKRAAGVYVRILSQPQLYIEGNHRTGALIMSYILMRDGKAPFVLTVDNAKAYFDPSTLIKETKKTATTMLMKLPGMKKRFAAFLHAQTHERYIYRVPVAVRLCKSDLQAQCLAGFSPDKGTGIDLRNGHLVRRTAMAPPVWRGGHVVAMERIIPFTSLYSGRPVQQKRQTAPAMPGPRSAFPLPGC